ncbi:zinc finger, CCHC-type containing protein [Tanacetum coccineum]
MAEEDALLAFQHKCGVSLTTTIPEDGENATMEQIRMRNKWENDDYVCKGLILNGMFNFLFDIYQNIESSKELWHSLEAKYIADDASSKKFLVSNFTNYKMTDSIPFMEQYNELFGIIGRFAQHNMDMDEDSDKPKSDNVAGPSVVNMKEHINSSRKPGHLKKDYKGCKVGNKANGSGTNGLANGSSNSLKGQNMFNKSLQHAKLGHVHFKRMQDISKDGLISAFDMDTKKCKTCMLTRITKKPFQNVKCETEVLELIHSNLHATPSLGNMKYFVTFIDDASRTDRGGEYMDTLYFQSIGIIHEKTAPYTQQNGISKRKNRVLKEMVNFMLFYSGLSQGFWGEAILLDPKLKTLGERGIKCIFVGYAEHSNAFRFYVIEPNDSVSINSTIESRDTIFDENRFSSVPRPSIRISNGTKDIGVSEVSHEVPTRVTEEVTDKGLVRQRWNLWTVRLRQELN